MQRIVAQWAAEERRSHLYRNRTGDLQRATRASEIIEIGDQRMVQFEMVTEYASYVVDKEKSFIKEFSEQADLEIQADLDKEADAED